MLVKIHIMNDFPVEKVTVVFKIGLQLPKKVQKRFSLYKGGVGKA